MYMLKSTAGTITFRGEDMAITSACPSICPEQNFIQCDEKTPAFVLGYLDDKNRYRQISSFQCADISVKEEKTDDCHSLTGTYVLTGKMEVVLTLRAEVMSGGEFTDFYVTVDNRSGARIFDIQYPFVVCKYHMEGEAGAETIALPHGYGSGKIIRNAGKTAFVNFGYSRILQPDSTRAWEFCASAGYANHYPGMIFAQFMCYYNDRAGFYISCDDTESHVKRMLALDHSDGIRFGVSHVGDWPEIGERRLSYKTRITFFKGDWHDGADIYRAWYMKQKWYQPIYQRQDVPKWLKDSPVYITVRPGGQIDEGPTTPQDEFLPYREKCIPMLENISKKVGSPLSIVMMSWEKRGPWVFPDVFPPVGGENGMKEFIDEARSRGWHVGTFSNGTHFVIKNLWAQDESGYDLYDEMNVDKFVCREADGSPWDARWGWRPCVNLCISQTETRKLAQDYVDHITDWGMESIQYLDQNLGAVTFPCFSKDHGHPPMPGKWMHEGMARFMEELKSITKPGLEPIHSAEAGLTEDCIPLFHETELRIYPPESNPNDIPLYQYLFHDCVILHAMMGYGPEPYNLALRNATAFIYGEIPGGVLRGDGLLLDRDTINWAEWRDEPVENQDNAMRVIYSCNLMRKSRFADYLVYGRMQKPTERFTAGRKQWVDLKKNNVDLACVFHSVWTSQDGVCAMALANWTDTEQVVSFIDRRFTENKQLTLYCGEDEITSKPAFSKDGSVRLTLPPLSCSILESGSK